MRTKASLVFFAGILLCSFLACSPPPVSSPKSEPPAFALVREEGAEVYAQNCAQCHGAGEGNGLNPALRESKVVQGDPAQIAKIIIQGQRGVSELNGQKLGGIMPGLSYLTDQEIAAVLTYIRAEYGGITEPILPDQVKAVR